jgi:hypothetical protein
LTYHSHSFVASRALRRCVEISSRASVLAGLLSVLSAPALADLYTWTDERGTTVISNVMPANPRKVANFEVVVKEEPRQAAGRAAADTHERTANEKLLLDRIDTLEREVRAQQAREKVTVAAPPSETSHRPAYENTADAFYPAGQYYPYPSYVFPYPPGYSWGYAPTTVVVGSSFGVPHRGYGPYRSFSSGRNLSRSVSVPVSVPVSYPHSISVRR